jgi:anti-sigma factor RsiW
MTCDRVQILLSDYIDGELSSAGVAGVQGHLKKCGVCEGEHQALRRTVQLVALYGRQEAPVDLREAVMARLRETPAPAPRMAWPSLGRLIALPAMPMPMPVWARATALAGLAVLSVSAGSIVMNRTQDVVPSPSPTRLVQDDSAWVRESSQLLQALGRDDGYILAADVADWPR